MPTQDKLIRSYCQSLGPIQPLGQTLGAHLEAAAREAPDQTAIIYAGRQITFARLNQTVDNLALGLLDLGLTRGDRLAICLPDWPEYTFLYLAAAKLGLAVSPISSRYRQREFQTILGHAGSKAVVVPAVFKDFDFVAMVEEQQDALPLLEHILVLGEHPRANQGKVRSLAALLSKDWRAVYPDDYLHRVYSRAHPVDGDTLLEIAYTSGTTGSPKGAMHTHNTRIAAAILNSERWQANPDDIILAMAPLCHSIGSNHAQNPAIVRRLPIIHLGAFDPESCLQAIERYKATVLVGVPAMYIALVAHRRFADYDLRSVRGLWCAGAPVPLEVARQFTTAFGAAFIHCYGSTECGGCHNTHLDDPVEVSCGSVGPPVRNMECKIVDEQGNTAPIGEPGEICIRGPMRLLGYYNNPEATQAAIDAAGWYKSGDLGVMDERGYVRIIGRIKDMIIRGGLNIYATEIEEVLYGHPAVEQVYVVGYPDDYLGERTCAFVKPRRPGQIITRDDLVPFVADKLAKYKIPDRVEIVEEFPMTPSGKVQKHKLRELLAKG